jgi:phosphoribosylanthranilate isomerase
MKIKVCGMREPGNIKRLVDIQPDYIGFIFYSRSKRFISEKTGKEIFDLVPASIKKVGVFVNEPVEELKKKARIFGLDFVQLHGNEDVGYCQIVKEHGIQIIKSFGVDAQFDMKIIEEFKPFASFFLFDTKTEQHGGSGKKFSWDMLKGYDNEVPFLISGGIGPGDVEALAELDDINIEAVDVNSGFETSPAVKNIEMLEEFILGISII